jgi:hypothetical protein
MPCVSVEVTDVSAERVCYLSARYACRLLQVGFSLGLFFYSENGSDMFHRNVVDRTTRRYNPEFCTPL